MHRANRGGTIVRRSTPNLGELRPPPQLTTSTQRQNVDCMEVEAGREEEAEGPTSESCFELGCFVLGWVGWVGWVVGPGWVVPREVGSMRGEVKWEQ